ncbi:tyrosine-type recombinase/integrase [uncultured Amnibacterium sp.]|uniref:tyrosine-type recombinase/integrase n=1 Tax=uncultured Amnibacterium sp. TaxID=1631851 RepID=UPI0035C97518
MTTPKRRKVNRRDFGSIRKLPSGRWQARYPDEHGKPMSPQHTFETKAEAAAHVAAVQTDRERGTYLDHRDGGVLFEVFAAEWIDNGGARGRLAPRTAELYRGLLARHLTPLHGLTLTAIRPDTVRRWYRQLGIDLAAHSTRGSGATAQRQAYAFLRAVMSTAVGDRKIAANPCTIVGAGIAEQHERPLLSVTDYGAVVEAHREHVRPALHTMFGAHLRLGELLGLQRGDVDLAAGTIRVERQVVTVDGTTRTTAPKSGTGRTVALPAVTVAVLREHLATTRGFAKTPLFVQASGRPFSRSQMEQAWRKAANAVGLPDAHLHDLRHAGLTLAAQAGATVAELKARGGHRTTAAAMRYQHAAEERSAVIAAGINDALEARSGVATGTRVARPALDA